MVGRTAMDGPGWLRPAYRWHRGHDVGPGRQSVLRARGPHPEGARATGDHVRPIQIRPPSRLYWSDSNLYRNSTRARLLVGLAAVCVLNRATGRPDELGGSPAQGRAIRLCRLCSSNALSALAGPLVTGRRVGA